MAHMVVVVAGIVAHMVVVVAGSGTHGGGSGW